MLAFVDDPRRPIWAFRDPYWIWPSSSRVNRSAELRQLVCRSTHLSLAVNAPLGEAFYCTADKLPHVGQPSCHARHASMDATAINPR